MCRGRFLKQTGGEFDTPGIAILGDLETGYLPTIEVCAAVPHVSNAGRAPVHQLLPPTLQEKSRSPLGLQNQGPINNTYPPSVGYPTA